MSKIDQVRQEMMAALKAQDKPRKDALSLLLASLKKRQIDKREALTEQEENECVYREIKEAQETLDTTPEGREDIRSECRFRIEVYSQFAPQRMGEEEIRALLRETLSELGLTEPTGKQKGQVMKALMPKVKGKADGALVNRLVSEALH